MRNFRQICYDEVVQTADIMHGAPSVEAARFREACCDLMLGSFGVAARSIIEVLPRGDWTVTDRVQFYPITGVCYDGVPAALVIHYFACGFIKGFLSSLFHLYSKHHWTGYDEALDEQCLLEACHHMCSRTARKFVLKYSQPKASPNPQGDGGPGQRPDLLPIGPMPEERAGEGDAGRTQAIRR